MPDSARAIFYAEWAEAPGTADGDVWQGMQRSSKRKYLNMAGRLGIDRGRGGTSGR